MALLGIDLGTSSVKALVLDEQGQTLSVSRAGYAVTSSQPGWSESDPHAWWNATLDAVHAALAQVPAVEITALGLSGQMHGVVLADEAGQPVRAALLWSDTRAQAEIALYQALPADRQALLANPLVPGMAGPLLCWLAVHEADSYRRARWALQPKDWLRWRLTGEVATDPSDASATLLYDLLHDTWADDIIAELHLDRRLLAPILPSGSIAGQLSSDAARQLNLPGGLPVATGAADTAAAALGTGLLTPGPVQLTLGTGAQLIQLCSQPSIDATGRTHLYRAADGINWYTMAAVQNAGLALNWVCQTLHASWEELYASASQVPPGSDGLLFLPYLTQERLHQTGPANSAAFLGMRIDHRREHLLHAALEGVAYGVRAALEALPASDTTSTLRLAGGGSEDSAWRQMLADILQRELLTIDTPDASARGAALLGGIVSNVWASALETAPIAPRILLITTPDAKNTTIYNDIYHTVSF